MPANPAKARELFLHAVGKLPPEQWDDYVAAACGGDAELEQQVRRFLQVHGEAGSFLESPAPGIVTVDLPVTEARGTMIGPYKLLEQIGEGGFGVVFMAEQTQPVRRKVALKVLKPGMDTRQVVARFEAERQALAIMDHPNIAKVYDGGVTRSGRPYFVMELIRGVPITDFCDQNRLTPRERLELFVPVCHAVQHAHQKGIIHRDLKPSNVLVAAHDGASLLKIIDFGVAKALGQELTDKTLFTGFAQMVGTPLYMSPEQAGQTLDIDTRSDIYSLGVLLYELLTGTTPFTEKRFQQAAYDEIRRIIREEEPPKPSTRLSESKDSLASLSACRHTEPAKLTKLVRGELDWIVMKTLEKDRNRRYETASALTADVERYLRDEPVQACPPSAAYQLRKLVRRNKGPVLTVAIVLIVLVGGIVGTAWGLVQARRSAAAEKAANELAKKRLAQIEKSNEILSSIFSDLDIREVKMDAQPVEVALAERLVKAIEELEGESVGDPLVVATLQDRLGVSLMNLGFPDRAIPVLEKSRQTRQEELGQDHADTLSSMGNLAHAYREAGKLDLALPLFEETFRLMKAKFGPDHPQTLQGGSGLGLGYLDAGRAELAVPLLEENLKRRKAKLGVDHPDTLRTMNDLAIAYAETGKLDLALPLKEETFKRKKARFGPDHPSTLTSMISLAEGYRVAGKLDQALPLYEEGLKLMRTKLGLDNPHTLIAMNNLALGYLGAGKLDLAVSLGEETCRLMKAKLGPDHPNTLKSMATLASGYRDAGKLDLALPLFEERLKLTKTKLGTDHPSTLMSMNDLAACYWSVLRLDKSIPLFEDLLKRYEGKLGRQHPDTLRVVANLGVNWKDVGRLEQALPLLEEAYGASKTYPMLRWVGGELLDAYIQAGRRAQSLALSRELLADARRILPPNSPEIARELAQIGFALLTMKEFADAERLLRESFNIREKTEFDQWTTFNTQSLLGGALLGQHKYADAEPLLLAGYAGMKKRENEIPPRGVVRLAQAADRSIELYAQTNKPDELKKWQAERTKYPPAKTSESRKNK